MCLSLRKESDKPYNNLGTRWKVIRVSGPLWLGPYQDYAYSKDSWNVSKPVDPRYPHPMLDGFHVFVSREEARDFLDNLLQFNHRHLVIKKVEVAGFMKSGEFASSRCETWNQMKFVE